MLIGCVFTGTRLEPSTFGGFGAEHALTEKITIIAVVKAFFMFYLQ